MAAFKEVPIGKWTDLIEFADHLDLSDGIAAPPYIFRGHADFGWRLDPTLHRAATNEGASPFPPTEELLRIEQSVTNRFRMLASIHLPSSQANSKWADFDWWPIMRHHGAPTRLLDWTFSLYVAAYFACSSRPKADGAVYVVHHRLLTEAMRKVYGDASDLPATVQQANDVFGKSDSPPVVHTFGRREGLSDRMIVQQGIFMACRSISADIEDILAVEIPKVESDGKLASVKIRIPAAQKSLVMRKLTALNVTASALFPGPDGVGRQLDEILRSRK